MRRLLLVALLVGPGAAVAGEPTLDGLLQQVREGRAADAADNEARMERFRQAGLEQAELLRQAQDQHARAAAESARLERQFDANEKAAAELERAFTERLGGLRELFGVLQQAAGDARGQFDNSITSVQYPDRSDFLTDFAQKMGQSTRLVSIAEIERLWFELQREMTESGKMVSFVAPVVAASGESAEREVTRIGVFNVVADGRYLNYVPETGRLVELPEQPGQRFLDAARDYENHGGGLLPLGIDPSRGQILSLLVQRPGVVDRIHQGGEIGYAILIMGALALLLGLFRLLLLNVTAMRMWRQARAPDNPGANPMGRVFKVYQEHSAADVETLELKLEEAILSESARFNKTQGFLKIIAVVAPLMGLLGTVTGMIVTFQAITLFGTGDPKIMAGGISQALVTTVLGLCVAIPVLLLHALVSTRARQLVQVLEQQAVGMVAAHAEAAHAGAAQAGAAQAPERAAGTGGAGGE